MSNELPNPNLEKHFDDLFSDQAAMDSVSSFTGKKFDIGEEDKQDFSFFDEFEIKEGEDTNKLLKDCFEKIRLAEPEFSDFDILRLIGGLDSKIVENIYIQFKRNNPVYKHGDAIITAYFILKKMFGSK